MRIRRPVTVSAFFIGLCIAFTALAQSRPSPQRTSNPHGPLRVACASCHTASSWRPIRPQPEFDHSTQTGWPLVGMHTGVACASCHIERSFQNVSRQCASCHADIHRRQFGANCAQCHTVQGWRVAVQQTREHSNRFPLLGAHAVAACESCHKSAAVGVFSGLRTDCAACHVADYDRALAPPHRTSKFPLQCDQCHRMEGWAGAKFDHQAVTGFSLSGAHNSLACSACHTAGQFIGTPKECAGCHIKQFNTTQNPNHVQAGFPRDCAVCHSSTQWKGAVFDHASRTSFALTGAHAQADCNSCHVAGRFAGTPQACEGCHLEDFSKTTNPAHVPSNFPKDCAQCHTTSQWKGAKFDHALSRFPLTGSHLQAECASCHVNGRFTGTTQACEGCHFPSFESAREPNHALSGFPKDCALCHTTVQWRGAQFDHAARTRFPLTGAHVSAQCNLCHANSTFSATPQNCESCHMDAFNRTTAPSHVSAGFSRDCSMCHTTSQWKGVTFDHGTRTRFTLSGAHTLVKCEQCHVNNRFQGTPESCEGCHLPDFKRTTDPDHVSSGFPTDCKACHTTSQWKGAKFDHAVSTRFPLTGAHAAAECAQCHKSNVFQGTPSNCEGCHIADFNGTANPSHVSAGFSKDCAVCHTTTQWKGAQFDHGKTRFPLTGAHSTAQCSSCHLAGVFAGTASTCDGCHLADFNRTTNPNHVTAAFPKDCAICHTTTRWRGAKFDHATSTRFPLNGAHSTVQCGQCHVNNVFRGTPSACEGCHLADYTATTNPSHVTAAFPKDCSVCHTTTQWRGAKFDHTAATRFPLTGAHTAAQCGQCHVNGVFKGAPSSCDGCHLANYNRTTNPNHATAAFPKDCALCHTATQWKGARFDHTASTKFPLTGAHPTVQCGQCHLNGLYRGTPSNCDGCHLVNYNSTTNPNHAAAGFPRECAVCHTTTQWRGAKFDHTSATRFPLIGAHGSVQCAQCHVNGVYKGTPSSCNGCHLADYNRTSNPNHVTASFPKDCAVCHNTTQWKGAKFDHTAATRFPLTGAHTAVQCAQCHVNGVYKGTASTCDGCHLANYNATTNPNHVTAAFPKDCTLCHTTTQWRGARFDHTASTRFPLTGAHTAVQCSSCHAGGKYAGTPSTCEGCHLAKYLATSNPNHVTAALPKDCALCHTTTQWKGARFDHTAATRFPLTGAHTSVQCASCHVGGKYSGTPSTCDGCHLDRYNATSNPNHVTAGFPKDCSVCHTTTSWQGAVFDHNKTRFPLTGAHPRVSCSSCHVGGRYAGTPTDCYACHRKAFETVSNPNHVTAGFPTTCTTCHTTAQWTGATITHKFPIYTGKHAGKWTTCNDCHRTPSTYAVFSCIDCHEHNKTSMDDKHKGRQGYVYESNACYQCHPTGRS